MALHALLRRRLSESEAQERIALELQRVVASADPDEVILFGSACRGELTDGSDVDFLALFQSEEKIWVGRGAYYRSRSLTGAPVDILFLTRDEFDARSRVGGVCFVAAREGRIVHRRGIPQRGEPDES